MMIRFTLYRSLIIKSVTVRRSVPGCGPDSAGPGRRLGLAAAPAAGRPECRLRHADDYFFSRKISQCSRCRKTGRNLRQEGGRKEAGRKDRIRGLSHQMSLLEPGGVLGSDEPQKSEGKKKDYHYFCQHNRKKIWCKECKGSQICAHSRQRHQCIDCRGSGICAHMRRRSQCRDCGGSQICWHKKRRSLCKECKGSQICAHGRRRHQCRMCLGSSSETKTLVQVDEVEGDGQTEQAALILLQIKRHEES